MPRPLLLPLVAVLFLTAGAATRRPIAGPPATDPPTTADLAGDWVGWAYLDEAGDLPLRLRVERTTEGARVRFDELVARSYDLPADLTWDPPRFLLTRTRPSGARIVLDGTVEGAEIRGRIDWASHQGDFELSHSPLAIARIPPESFADLTGTYRLSPERILVVGSRFWGELLVTDLASGRFATLFPTDRDTFFVGAAHYLPAPVDARLRFQRDDDGAPVAVTWEEDGATLAGPRIAFVEEEVAFESDGARLAGLVIRPDHPGPLPAAVVIPGSDWSDRESGRRDAEVLASFGVATLVYDQRGFGASGGDQVVPFAQTARDAAAALALLAGRDDVLPGQVGLTGRSRGGWIAPLTATLAPETAAFLVLFVPPAVSPATQETTRRLHLLADEGFSADDLAIARQMLAAAWRYAATGESWEAYAQARRRAVAAGLPEEVFEPADATDPEWEWTRLNMAYDPIPTLESLSVPLLALFGEDDRNVVVADNLPAMRAALERGGHPDFELFVVPDADHGLRALGAERDLPLHRRVGFGSSGWPEVARWLDQRLDLAVPAPPPADQR